MRSFTPCFNKLAITLALLKEVYLIKYPYLLAGTTIDAIASLSLGVMVKFSLTA